ncbi:MAG: winged helix-turn-helix transcriptional regulator [Lysobacterales bacterium]
MGDVGLQDDPGLSIPELAAQLGKSESAVERAIRKLRESGRLKRVGPDKGGRWQVLDGHLP